ncbi:MAG TPA: hypothetical protein VKE74_02230 [Gemmataceae bacterium]|nr:hypothetical protein [Gemmataceae bacterium]
MLRRQRLFVTLGIAFALVAACGQVCAQPPVPMGPTSRPAFSPYLNLLRRDNSPGVNYYGLVRPQFTFQNNIQSLQQQVTTIGQMENTGPGSDLPITGQPVYFLNTGGYFMNTRGGGPGSSPTLSNRPMTNAGPLRPPGPVPQPPRR